MDKYRILKKDFYVNLMNDHYAEEDSIIKNEIKKSSPKFLMRELIESKKNADFEVKIGEWNFKCHLAVLQSYSIYFRQECFRTERTASLPIEQVSPSTFTKIYNWILSDEPKIQREGFVELFISAFYLGVEALVDHIWTCLNQSELIKENEAFQLYYEATLAHVNCFKEVMLKRISKFFLIMVAFREFTFMSVGDLCCLMSADAIGVNSEIEVFMACLRWLTYKWVERKKFLLQIMQTVRFGLMPPGFLIELDRDMIDNRVIKKVMSKPRIRQLIIEGLKQATTQFCYGNNCNLAQRQWLYDEKCDYHLKVNNLIDYKITYEKFLEYLYFLQKCKKDHWHAFVFIKNEVKSLTKTARIRHLQLLQESSKTCIVEVPKVEENSKTSEQNESTISSIQEIPQVTVDINSDHRCETSKVRFETQAKNEALNSKHIIKFKLPSQLEATKHFSTDSSTTSSGPNWRERRDKAKRYLKKRRSQAKIIEPKIKDPLIFSLESKSEVDLPMDKAKTVDQPDTSASSDDQDDSIRQNEEVEESLKTQNQNEIAVQTAEVNESSSSDDDIFFDIESAACSTSKTLQVENSNNTNENSLMEDEKQALPRSSNTGVTSRHDKARPMGTLESTLALLRRGNLKSDTILKKESSTTRFRCLLKNKTLLILGGIDPFNLGNDLAAAEQRRSFIDKVLLYNDKLKQWVQLPHTAFGTRHHHCAVVCQGLVYIIGGTKVLLGCNKTFFETSIWSFDPKLKIWTFATNLPQNRRDFAALAIAGADNQAGFLIIGGETYDRKPLNTVWLYKVKEKVWEQKASLNVGRYGFAATVIGGKEIWIGGGIAFSSMSLIKTRDGESNSRRFTEFITDTIEYFSLKNIFDENVKGKWIKLPYRLPKPCLYGKFCAINEDKVFLIGGFGTDASKTLNSFDAIYCFNINSKHWLTVGSLEYARHGHEVILIDDFIIIIGGVSSKLNCALDSIEMFSTKTQKFKKFIPDLPWPKSGFAAVIVRGEY